MLPLALSFAALGIAVTQLAPGEQTATTDNYDDIDDLMYGRIREENYTQGNNYTSESSRIVRPMNGKKDPAKSAKVWTDYHRNYNKALQDLYVKHKIADNQRILRTTVESNQRILCLPDSTFAGASTVPNAYVDYASAPTNDFRLDIDYSKYDDKVGNAGGMPIHGNEYIWNPADFFGNPWGASGQLYNHLRTKSNYPSAYGDVPEKLKSDKRVRFGGTTVF